MNRLLRIIFIVLIFVLSYSISIAQTVETITSTQNWICPIGVTSVQVECWGGGGGGAGSTSTNGRGGGGGGGGAYAKLNTFAVIPGNSYAVTVGQGGTAGTTTGAGGAGNPTWFYSAGTVYAAGGDGGVTIGGTGGAGGTEGASVGDVKYAGGAGASTIIGNTFSGGGGGGAGNANTGGDASTYISGAGGVSGGGNGAAGRNDANGAGIAGTAPGGAGSGGYRKSTSSRAGGAGARGQVILTYTIILCTPPTVQTSNFVADPNPGTALCNVQFNRGDGDGGMLVVCKAGSKPTAPIAGIEYNNPNANITGGGSTTATGSYVVYNSSDGTTGNPGSQISVPVSGLLPNTLYYIDSYEWNSAGQCYLLTNPAGGNFTTASCSPSTQPTNLSIYCPQYTSMTLQFDRGNGTQALVLAKAGSAVDADPVYDKSYTANANFGSGSEIGTGNFVVYNGNDAGIVSVPITGLTSGTSYYFKIYEYNATPNCFNLVSAPTISQSTRALGTYISSSITQNTANVYQGGLAQDIIRLNVNVGGGVDLAATINSITFTTGGSTNTATDITNAKIFYTGNSNFFSNATQFGNMFTSFTGNLTATDNFALLSGNNYFWIVYDVNPNATIGNVLDATIVSINITDNTGISEKILNLNPAGNRPIVVVSPIIYCNGVTPTATCAGSGCNFSCSQGEYLKSINLSGAEIVSHNGWPCNSTCGNDLNSYTDMYSQNVYSLKQGTTYNMSISFESWFSVEYDWVLWVDWGQDGIFTNGSPERYPTTSSIDEWTSQNIGVPASVTKGNHRARLWIQEFSYAPTTPCRTSRGPLTTSIGYIVDFTIYVPDGSLADLNPALPGAVSCATLAPVVTTPLSYIQGDVASQLTASGENLLWYTSATGGTGSVTAPTPSTTTTGTYCYYVSQTDSCEGPRTQIAVNVTATPCCNASGPPVITVPVCEGTTVSGISYEADGTEISVIRSGSSIGTTNVVSNKWTAIVSALSVGDVLTATANGPEICLSTTSSPITVQSTTSSPSIASPICSGTTVSGTSNEPDGTEITVIRNGLPIGTATVVSNLWIATVAALSGGDNITATATAPDKCESVATSFVTITSAPIGGTPTANPLTICSGSSSIISLTGNSGSIQWQSSIDNVIFSDIDGETGISVNTAALTSTNFYRAIVTSGVCPSVTSAVATVTVNPNVPVSVSAVAEINPVCSGTSVTFTANTINGGSSPLYQWKVNGSNQGLNNSTFTYAPLNSDIVACVVTSNASCATGSPATSNNLIMTVNAHPLITSQPLSISSCAGTNINFNISVTGTGTLSYQWYKNNEQLAMNNEQLNLNNINLSDAGNYSCVISNLCGNVTSSAAILTVNSAPMVISKTPDAIRCTRDSVAFKLNISASPLPSFQWSKGGVNISGATRSTYQIGVLLPSDAGMYTCIMSNVCGTTSANISLSINNSPFIQDTIPNQSVCEGNNIIFSFHAIGNNLSYQWAKIDGPIADATTSVYSINNLKLSDGNIYTCSVSNSCDSKTIYPFVLNINQKPVISIVPLIQKKDQGDSLTYSLSPTGSAPFYYQWMKDNEILAGKTMNPYKIKPIECFDAGVYSVVISNMCGNTVSEAGTLQVNCGGRVVSGYVRYNDKAQKPMTNTTVYLENSNAERVASAQTDETGYYEILKVLPGDYKLTCETSYKWGGSNPTDALLTNKYFVALYNFGDDLKKKAADVNLDGKINSTDALIINRRFVLLINKFTAPDWIFETTIVIVAGADIQQDIKAICTGDVDGSY